MKILLIALLLFSCTSFNYPLADTWAGTADNQLVTGNALRDGATASGVYTITTTIPAELNKKAMTKANLSTYTDIPVTNEPLNSLPSNQCPTKITILGVF